MCPVSGWSGCLRGGRRQTQPSRRVVWWRLESVIPRITRLAEEGLAVSLLPLLRMGEFKPLACVLGFFSILVLTKESDLRRKLGETALKTLGGKTMEKTVDYKTIS